MKITAALLLAGVLMSGAAFAGNSSFGRDGSVGGQRHGEFKGDHKDHHGGGGSPGCRGDDRCDHEHVPGVPEPATWAMLAIGAGLVAWRVRRLRAAAHS